jgi:glycerol-3-phosphate cytidylyltransferase
MRVVLTYGTFDTIHYGHIELLKRAKLLGDYLIVGLSTDDFNGKKGKKSKFNYDKRYEWLSTLNCVDKIIPENSWDQKILDIKEYNVNLFVIGDDWLGKFDDLPCEVMYLPRTAKISSTKIKKSLDDKY